jgi:hypothetical protein
VRKENSADNFKIDILIRTLRSSSTSDSYSLPSDERGINPVYLNFPLVYEYWKYFENRL